MVLHLGGREVFIAEGGRRTAKDFAACLDHLANHVLPEADKIILVMDNPNTHKESSLYEAFPPEKSPRVMWTFPNFTIPRNTAAG